jgi:hypothetical protein
MSAKRHTETGLVDYLDGGLLTVLDGARFHDGPQGAGDPSLLPYDLAHVFRVNGEAKYNCAIVFGCLHPHVVRMVNQRPSEEFKELFHLDDAFQSQQFAHRVGWLSAAFQPLFGFGVVHLDR